MTQLFTKTATIEFALYGKQARVTVSDLPFTYKAGDNVDQQAIFTAINFLRDGGFNHGLDVVSVCTSPIK